MLGRARARTDRARVCRARGARPPPRLRGSERERKSRTLAVAGVPQRARARGRTRAAVADGPPPARNDGARPCVRSWSGLILCGACASTPDFPWLWRAVRSRAADRDRRERPPLDRLADRASHGRRRERDSQLRGARRAPLSLPFYPMMRASLPFSPSSPSLVSRGGAGKHRRRPFFGAVWGTVASASFFPSARVLAASSFSHAPPAACQRRA